MTQTSGLTRARDTVRGQTKISIFRSHTIFRKYKLVIGRTALRKETFSHIFGGEGFDKIELLTTEELFD